MSCIHFWALFDESIAITRELTAAGLEIVPVPALFPEPAAARFATVTDALVATLRLAPAHYLAGTFTRFPISFVALKNGMYAIELLEQGPLIQALVARTNTVDDSLRLLYGTYSIQRQYRNPETRQWEPASKEIKQAFREVVRVVKKHCPRFEYKPGVEIFIAPRALEALQRGEVTIDENQILPGGTGRASARIVVKPRAHPRANPRLLATLRGSYEGWLARHRAALASAPPERLLYAWAAVENDCVQLAGILHGEGAAPSDVRAMLAESARAHLEVVRLRGASFDATKPTPDDGYSTGSSRSTFLAICRAFTAREFELGRALAPFVWDPPDARYIGRGSLFGTEQTQAVSYALRDLLLGDRDAAHARLAPLVRILEDLIGDFLLVKGVLCGEADRVLKGLGLALSWHRKAATTPANANSPTYLLAVSAVGLVAFAVREGILARDTLPTNDPDFPIGLIEGGEA